MAQEITQIEDVEEADTIGRGMVDWTVTGVQYESGGFGGRQPHVKLKVVDGYDDNEAWPDEGTTKDVQASELRYDWEVRN